MDSKQPLSDPNIPTAVAHPILSQTKGNAVSGGDGRTYYCEKCHAPYELPSGATSWRCANCSTFNSTTPAQCPWCTVL